jgi:hypothetical protein
MNVPRELLSHWEQVGEFRYEPWFTGAYSEREREAFDVFQALLDQHLPGRAVIQDDVPEVFGMPQWIAVRDGAQQLLKVLQVVGEDRLGSDRVDQAE